jgi:5-methylthioadenosine/S-adenosylhomocysteine deaminase
MEDFIGSIAPSKRADLILIDTRTPNMAPFHDDPAALIVDAAHPSNADTVMIGGRLVKRHGRLLDVETEELAAKATASIKAIRQRGGF